MHFGLVLAFLASLLVGAPDEVRIEFPGKTPRIVRVHRSNGALRVELLGVIVPESSQSVQSGVVHSVQVHQSGDFAIVEARVSGQPRVILKQISGKAILAISTRDLVHNPPFEFDHEPLSLAVARIASALDLHYVLEPRASHQVVTGVFESDDPMVSLRILASNFKLEVREGRGFVAVGARSSLNALSMDRLEYSFLHASTIRQEILLEHVPAAKLMPKLRRSYKHVSFQLAPQINGF